MLWLQYVFKPVCCKLQWGTGCSGGQISEAKLGGHPSTVIHRIQAQEESKSWQKLSRVQGKDKILKGKI